MCNTSITHVFLLLKVSPESAQDDHSCGEGHQRGAVAHCVQSLHWHIIHILKKNMNTIRTECRGCNMKIWTWQPVVNSQGGCCFLPHTGRLRYNEERALTSQTLCSYDSPSPILLAQKKIMYIQKINWSCINVKSFEWISKKLITSK